MTKRILTKAFDELDIVKKDRDLEIPGILGWVLNGVNTVDVPNREGYVYVRLRSNTSELIQAYNDMVSPVFGLPVLVIRDEVDKTRYKIKGKDLGIYQDWGNAPYLPRHGNTHSFFGGAQGGGDVVFVHPQQFMPLLAHPSGSAGSSSLVIEPYTFYDGSNWKYVGGTGTVNLTTYNPTGSNARMVLVYIDADGNPNYEAGSSYFSTSITGAAQVIPYIPQPPTGTAIPVAAVRLVSGTSIINWANLYETRPFFNLSGTASGGGGGGGAPTTSQYVTMALDGTLSAERVLTAGADITITDGGANGNVTVGVTTNTFASGSHTHPAGTSAVIVYDDSVYKTTGTAISFDKDLSVSATGTVAFVGIPANTFASGSHTHPSSVSPIVIYEDSAYKSTGTAISFNQYLDVVATGSSAFVDVNIPDGIFASGSHTHPAGASAIQIYEDSVYKATGTLISFNNNLDVIVTGTSVFVNSTATGGGGSYPVIYDDSTYKVTGSAISFDKDLSVVVTGSTAYVDIPAGTFASGSHTHPAGATAIQIYDDSVFVATGTTISFDTNLSVIATGTVAFISSSGGGGNNTYTSSYANRPSGTFSDGDLFLPSDGIYIERASGTSAWQSWSPIWKVIPPPISDFTWVNSGTAVADESQGGIHLSVTNAGGENLRILKKSAPSVPYTITALILFNNSQTTTGEAGLCFRESSTGLLHVLRLDDNRTLGSTKHDAATAGVAHYVQKSIGTSLLLWMRIADNNTNRICSWSRDGRFWHQLHSVSRTDYLTANEVGFFVGGNTTVPEAMWLLSWEES